uniref:Uncharacterized protein n=1 Tax=Moniliophthora roreri TaxID=221103 RepID=A0A0W0FSD3_MONRR
MCTVQHDESTISIVVAINYDPLFNQHVRQSSWLDGKYSRRKCVEVLFQQVLREHFVLVRGTPASGKTTLLYLLRYHVEKSLPGDIIEELPFWMPNPDVVLGFTIVGLPFKLQSRKPEGLFIVLFALYDSPPQSTSQSQTCQYGTPHRIPGRALIGLIPTTQVTHSILFTEAEYSSFLSRVEKGLSSEKRWPRLDEDLQDYFFKISKGHIDVTTSLFYMATTAKMDAKFKYLPRLYVNFMVYWESQDRFMQAIKNDADNFCRGLPAEHMSTAWTKTELSSPDPEQAEALQFMKTQGWMYVYESPNDDTAIRFPSPLHLSWFSNKLLANTTLPPDLASMPFETFWQTVLRRFSPAAFRSPPHAEVAKSGASFVEAQYQNQFYRSIYALTEGAMAVSPEYGQYTQREQGRIDFFVASKKWGFELLRDSDRIKNYLDSGGAYHPWIAEANSQTSSFWTSGCRNLRRHIPTTLAHSTSCIKKTSLGTKSGITC